MTMNRGVIGAGGKALQKGGSDRWVLLREINLADFHTTCSFRILLLREIGDRA